MRILEAIYLRERFSIAGLIVLMVSLWTLSAVAMWRVLQEPEKLEMYVVSKIDYVPEECGVALADTGSGEMGVESVKYYRVSGTSMEPVLYDGDYLEVKLEETPKVNDLVVARLRDGKIVVKELQDDRLVSKNPSGMNYSLEDVEIIGRATQSSIPTEKPLELAEAASGWDFSMYSSVVSGVPSIKLPFGYPGSVYPLSNGNVYLSNGYTFNPNTFEATPIVGSNGTYMGVYAGRIVRTFLSTPNSSGHFYSIEDGSFIKSVGGFPAWVHGLSENAYLKSSGVGMDLYVDGVNRAHFSSEVGAVWDINKSLTLFASNSRSEFYLYNRTTYQVTTYQGRVYNVGTLDDDKFVVQCSIYARCYSTDSTSALWEVSGEFPTCTTKDGYVLRGTYDGKIRVIDGATGETKSTYVVRDVLGGCSAIKGLCQVTSGEVVAFTEYIPPSGPVQACATVIPLSELTGETSGTLRLPQPSIMYLPEGTTPAGYTQLNTILSDANADMWVKDTGVGYSFVQVEYYTPPSGIGELNIR